MSGEFRIRPLRHDELPRAAAFIAQLNRNPSDHIGYCGTVYEEILHTFTEDFGDVPAADTFVVAELDGEISGLLGFDADLKRGVAELWGPFTKPQSVDLSLALLRNLPLPQTMRKLQVFCNAQNVTCIRFAEQESFIAESGTQILVADKSALTGQSITVSPLMPAENDTFIALHDKLFPNTYYSGREITGYINDVQKVLVVREGAELMGYVYVETTPEFVEASIEFVGVRPQVRGKGVGTKLVQSALAWIFSFAEIEEVTLVVSEENRVARGLYQAAGFSVKHEMRSFHKVR